MWLLGVRRIQKPMTRVLAGFLLLLGGCSSLKSSGRVPKQLTLDKVAIPPGIDHQKTHAIVQRHDEDIHIQSDGGAILTITELVTVLDKKGRDEGKLVVPYDKFLSIRYVNGSLYNSKGVQLNKLSTNDGQDFSAAQDFSLYEDNRLKYYELIGFQYPYTVRYEYQIKLGHLLNWPSWRPQDENEYVVESSYTVTSPKDFDYSYLEDNLNIKPDTSSSPDGEKVKKWVFRDHKAFELQELAPYYKVVPRIQFSAKKFTVESYPGSTQSWSNFGSWFYQLSKDGRDLPDALKARITSLLSGASSRIDSLHTLYSFLKKNTRYISVQLGIGGWKPFPASYVYDKGYGDCKALSNYMVAILQYYGFKAYPALIYSAIRNEPIDPDFPSNQFNHVIVYMPNNGHPIWLECTDPHMPFGQLGVYNANRYALVVTPRGGKLIRTPELFYKDNRENQFVDITIDSLGNSVINVDSKITGSSLEYVRDRAGIKSKDDQEKWLRNNVNVPEFTLNSYKLSGFDYEHNEGEVKYSLNSSAFVSKTGGRLFVPLNRLNHWYFSLGDNDEKRTQPVDLIFGFSETDTTVIHIPDSYVIESEPKPVVFEKKFGGFSAHIEKDGNRILYIRTIQLRKHYFSVDEYPGLKDFMEQISSFDKHVLVLNRRKVAAAG